MKRIISAGSLNMDFVLRVEKLPDPGQTVRGSDFQMTPGGKGANQAAAVGKLGGNGVMFGKVGADVFGAQLRASLASCGCDSSRVLETSATSTGVAFIFVGPDGGNQIAVAGGANHAVTAADVAAAEDLFAGAGFLLVQLEIPLEAVLAALKMARKHGLVSILDPAPARELPAEVLQNVDICTPNETEVLTFAAAGEPEAMARALRARGPRTVILKLGAQGALVCDDSGCARYPAPAVNAVDTVAAGDCFNGALAVALAEGRALPDAVRFANRAASISVTRPGAQASLPSRAEVDG